jgi:hypothetical protein
MQGVQIMSKTTRSAREGIEVGILAGLVLATAELIAGPVTANELLRIGIPIHLGLSAAFGLIYGLINSQVSEDVQQNPWAQAAIGIAFGAAIYALDFQGVARFAYPWLLDVPQLPQLAMHALAFGLPLGLIYAAIEWRVHTVPKHRPVYAAR